MPNRSRAIQVSPLEVSWNAKANMPFMRLRVAFTAFYTAVRIHILRVRYVNRACLKNVTGSPAFRRAGMADKYGKPVKQSKYGSEGADSSTKRPFDINRHHHKQYKQSNFKPEPPAEHSERYASEKFCLGGPRITPGTEQFRNASFKASRSGPSFGSAAW